MLVDYYRTAGGSGIWRIMPEAQALWRKVPAPIRLMGPEGLKEFHKGKAWSHINPRALGGPDTADNGIWWSARKNQQLGPRPMTRSHINNARSVLLWQGVRAGMLRSIGPLTTASLASMVIVGVLVILELGLRFYVGDITHSEMVQGVFAAVLAAGRGSFLFTGLLMGIALAFPVLLPILQVVTIAMVVVGFVFLLNDVVELGQSWWAALDEKGHLDQFLVELRILEEYLGSLSNRETTGLAQSFRNLWRRGSAWFAGIAPDVDFRDVASEFDYARYFPDRDWQLPDVAANIGQAAVEALPDWQLAVPQWNFNPRLGRFVPDFAAMERLPSLELNVGEVLADLELPSLDNLNLELPDLRRGARSAQDALVSASAYVASRGATEPSGTDG